MGNQPSIVQKCNFEDIQDIISKRETFMLINTLLKTEQECLIKGTTSPDIEVSAINSFLSQKMQPIIFVYGKNCNDDRVYEKYRQLKELGFEHVYVYKGGMFEWLCLQDIYGDDEFPTTKKELDILRYKPRSNYNQLLIQDYH